MLAQYAKDKRFNSNEARETIFRRFECNILNDTEPFDRDQILKTYSDFSSTVLFESDLNNTEEPKLKENIEYIIGELKNMAENILGEISKKPTGKTVCNSFVFFL